MTTDSKPPTDTVLIAKFFGLKGRDALTAVKELTAEDKKQLGDGIRNGTLTY